MTAGEAWVPILKVEEGSQAAASIMRARHQTCPIADPGWSQQQSVKILTVPYKGAEPLVDLIQAAVLAVG